MRPPNFYSLIKQKYINAENLFPIAALWNIAVGEEITRGVRIWTAEIEED